MFTSTVVTVRQNSGWNRTSSWRKIIACHAAKSKEIEQFIEGHYDELKHAWKEHFPD